MRFSAGHGALAGLAGGAAMLAVVALPGVAGRSLPLDVVRFWRGIAGRGGVALLLHAALSALVGVAFAAVAAATLGAGAAVGPALALGLAFGVVHALVALVVLPSMLRRFPAALESSVEVGRFCVGLGALAVATAVAAHLAFGAVAALVYRALVV
jgi:hypothetical protein